MKCFLALLALTLAPITVAAQQTERQQSEGDPCGELFVELFSPKVIQCLEIQRQQEKEQKAKDDAKLLELKEKAEEAQKAYDNLKRLQSGDQSQQIDGVIGAAKQANSDANNNTASKAVTDKSVDFMEQVAHQEKELLDNVGKTIGTVSETPAGSPSTFNSEGHQLIETRGSGAKSTLDDQIDEQQGGMLASPSTVAAVAKADRAEQVREQAEHAAEQAQKKREEVEQRAALAAAERAAQQARVATEKAEQDAQDAEDARLERRARAERAAAARMFYAPSYVPYVPSYVPYVPAFAPTLPDAPSDFSWLLSLPSSTQSDQNSGPVSTDGKYGGPTSTDVVHGSKPAPPQ